MINPVKSFLTHGFYDFVRAIADIIAIDYGRILCDVENLRII